MMHNPDITVDEHLGISYGASDLMALLEAESSMGEPPAVGKVDFESGAAILFEEDAREELLALGSSSDAETF